MPIIFGKNIDRKENKIFRVLFVFAFMISIFFNYNLEKIYAATFPDAPTSLTPTYGDAQVSLSWTAPAWDGGNAVTDYVVDYKLSSDSTWATFADPTSTLTTLVVAGLANGLSYDFRVSAVNGVGQGTASATATSTPVNPLDRYWVGGTGNWSDTLHWSNTDGGTGGQTAPTSTNNVYFSAGSLSADGAVVTLDTVADTNSLDFSGLDQTMTLTSTTNALNVYGSISLSTKLSVSFTNTAYLNFKSTSTGNTIMSNLNNSSWNRIYFDGVGGSWMNQDDWNVGSSLFILKNGVWNTNSKIITSTGSFSTEAGTKTLTLGSSIFNIGIWSNAVPTGFTFNYDNSTVVISPSYISFATTFYNLTLQGTASIASIFTLGTSGIVVTNNLTINGNNSTNYRLLLANVGIGTQRTITVDPAKVTASNVDFRDIKFQNQ